MKVLEVELEEQLHSNQDLATQLLEVAELKQQIQVLEKQLKNQRQFMDVSKFVPRFRGFRGGKYNLRLRLGRWIINGILSVLF